ncbi:MAG: hypothetical protein J5755_03375, partial [Clostridia bacterium]|nr:hypothetical protein [Clostridia bacterium]
MKRLLRLIPILVLVVALTLSVSVAGVASADLVSQFADPYEGMAYFSNNYADRTECTDQEANAAQVLANALAQMGYVGLDGNMIQEFTFRQEEADESNLLSLLGGSKTVEYTSRNVVAIRRSTQANAPLLVLASNYGNVRSLEYGGTSMGGECVYETSSSVGLLMSLAHRLSASGVNLPYDLAFLFIGADYYGYYGADAFFKN